MTRSGKASPRRRALIRYLVMFVVTLVLNGVLKELRNRGILTTPMLFGLLAVVLPGVWVLLRYWWLPRVSRAHPQHERIVTEARWASPLAPGAVIERLRAEFVAPEFRTAATDSALHIVTGSDETFRWRGAGSMKGWKALPLAVDIVLTAAPTGCGIVALARDDLGWYETPPEFFVETEVQRRGAALIRRARAVTEAPATDG
ncbi:hypothetical protein ACNHUS_27525 [Actinomycetes bacterium M1A6_2h]